MSAQRSFTGRRRKRTTSPLVWWTDRIAKVVIAVGGVGTIIAVLLVCVFLVYVAVPLFEPAQLEDERKFQTDWAAQTPRLLGVDEYRLIGWALFDDGELHAFRLDNGQALGPPVNVRNDADAEAAGPSLTAASSTADGALALGFEDGSFRTGKVSFETTYFELDSAPEAVKDLPQGEIRQLEDGVAVRTGGGQIRVQKLALKVDPRVAGETASAVRLVDFTESSHGPLSATLTEDGKLKLNAVSKRVNLLTDEEVITVSASNIPLPKSSNGEAPACLLISGLGDNVFVAYRSGMLLRFDTRNFEQPQLAEQVDLVPEAGEELTALQFLLGRATLVAGDSLGRITAWFGAKPENTTTSDGIALVKAHEFPATGSPVTSLAMSSRVRMAAAGYQSGQVRVFYVTSQRQMFEEQVEGNAPITGVSISPKSDALIALTAKGISRWDFDPLHPEISISTLFRPVWYEGYAEPTYAWQTSSGTDKFEPKYSLTPLVYGTLKATFYSMIFGAPIALLAAIYTSEFLSPRWKGRIKPTIEMMASLPSVVLGFIAGLVIAPAIENIVPSVVACFFAVPLAFLLGAQLWRLLPSSKAIQFARFRFPLMLCVALPLGILVGAYIGPIAENLLFGVGTWRERIALDRGDFKAWLNHNDAGGTTDSAMPGWMVMFLPISGLTVVWIVTTYVNPWLRRASIGWRPRRAALVSAAVFLCGLMATLMIALVVGAVLDVVHVDPRGSFVDTYVQRNALIVGFIMGFAIIPIIYTLADDALSSVPGHLRSASLGAGATPWQTATRIIIPTAMSGLFSALMIGLGRAVGETMIVLMAAGNTPIMKWNIFNGFQTLSAAIATELPEAARGSTHYRTLFLAALTLFVMTFLVNTIAETVRQRFRRRAYEL
jgi:phosphate transport system permease protein